MKNALYLFLLIICFNVNAQIQKVEPPFWWTGMKMSEIQVLVYGEDISNLQPKIDDSRIKLTSVDRVQNENYIFLNLEISKDAQPGWVEINFYKGKKRKYNYSYQLLKRNKNANLVKGFDNSDVMYLITPDRFANGDSENDELPEMKEKLGDGNNDRHGGDLQGIIDHLDYIKDLGFTSIWLNPALENNMERFSYHGYSTTDYYKIDPRFGNNKLFKELSYKASEKGIKIIMDVIPNHCGSEHWFFKDPPTQDWFNNQNNYKNTTHNREAVQDIHAAEIDKSEHHDGWFVETMPDLNQGNSFLSKYLIQNAIWWIEYADLDGFRVDTYSFNDKEGIAKWTKAITDEYPNFNIAGEVWMHDQAQMAYWQKDSKVGAIQGYNSNLPSVMDFTLHDAIMEVFKVENPTWNTGIIQLYENFVNDFLYPDINNILVFAENHDTPRINELYPNFEDYQLAMTLIATVRGIPQIYYGSEIGMKGDKVKGDGDIRRDFPGGWQGDSSSAFTANGRNEVQNKYFNFSKKLFNWRKNASVVHEGKTIQYVPEQEVYVYFRFTEEKTVMIILNNNKTSKELSLDRFAENLKGFQQGKDVLTNSVVKIGTKLTIGPKKSMILEMEK